MSPAPERPLSPDAASPSSDDSPSDDGRATDGRAVAGHTGNDLASDDRGSTPLARRALLAGVGAGIAGLAGCGGGDGGDGDDGDDATTAGTTTAAGLSAVLAQEALQATDDGLLVVAVDIENPSRDAREATLRVTVTAGEDGSEDTYEQTAEVSLDAGASEVYEVTFEEITREQFRQGGQATFELE